MPKQITITAYTFEELNDLAQDRAVSNQMSKMKEHFDNQIAATFAKMLENDYGLKNMKIFFSFDNERDYLDFYGDVDINHLANCKSIDSEIKSLIQKLQTIGDSNRYRIELSSMTTGTHRVFITISGWHMEKFNDDDIVALDNKMTRYLENVENILKKIGRDMYQKSISDEACEKYIQENQFLFDQHGNICTNIV